MASQVRVSSIFSKRNITENVSKIMGPSEDGEVKLCTAGNSDCKKQQGHVNGSRKYGQY